MSDRGKLGTFLKKTINWQWDEFVKAEKDTNYTGYEAAVFALIRTASEGKLGAIKLAIDRVDGKVETPIKFEYPKVYLLFPEATSVALPDKDAPMLLTTSEPVQESQSEAEKEEPVKATTLTLRQTLETMAEQKRILVQVILRRKLEVENAFKQNLPFNEKEVPLVKSVIAANLLNLAEKNNFEAIMEVFDQIDGKLVETIRILGDDLYLSSYSLVAPYGAKKNKDGVYQLAAPQIENSWKQKLKKD